MTAIITNDYVLAAGQQVSGLNQDALTIQGSIWTNVSLNGQVLVTIAADTYPVFAVRAGTSDSAGTVRTVTIGATGSLSVDSSAPGVYAGAIASGGGAIKILNLGSIDVRTQGDASGVSTGSGGFENRGAIAVTSTGSATGVFIEGGPRDGGAFTNSGTILVTGGSRPFQGSVGVQIYNHATTAQTYVNTGTIRVSHLDPVVVSVGVVTGGPSALLNSGLIEADQALKLVRNDNLVDGIGNHVVTNSGTLKGAVYLNNSTGEPVILTNSGVIQGEVTLNLGNDSYNGAGGALTGVLHGMDGSDVLLGGAGAETLCGDAGNDTIQGGDGGADVLEGGAGSDQIGGGRGAVSLRGGDGADTLTAVYNNAEVKGGAGDDTIRLDGYFTDDPLHLTRLDGGDGDDSFRVFALSGRALTIDGGSGRNALEMHYLGYGVEPITVHLNGDPSGGAWVGSGLQTLTVIGHVASIVGGAASETITAPGVIDGGGGDDVLTGSNPQMADPGSWLMTLTGADTINGGAGSDTINGLSGQSYLRGDEGDDRIVGGAGFDDANGNMGNDTLSTGVGDDWAVGGRDNDSLSGEAGGDVVWGNLGNDTCDGGDGNDQVRGGQGDDSVAGGAGDDYVSGDRGNDTITGGTGADLFHGSQDAGIDRVLDFNLAQGDRVFLDPGTTYTLAQVGADTVLDMGGGHQMILVGVQISTLTQGWVFGS